MAGTQPDETYGLATRKNMFLDRPTSHGGWPEGEYDPPINDRIYNYLKSMGMIQEQALRTLIRAILEGRPEFEKDVEDISIDVPFGDPLFRGPENKANKQAARDVKRSWNKNVGMKMSDPDRAWIQSLTKVHWIHGYAETLLQKINRTLASDRRGELSASLYEPKKPVELLKDWGNLGLEIDGWISLAAQDMDILMSGYIGDAVPEDPSVKIPRYPTYFGKKTARAYVMSPKDRLFGRYASKRNEAFVGNWKPVRWVIGPGFFAQIDAWDGRPEAQAILDKIKSTGLPITDLDGKTLKLDFHTLLDYMTRSTS